METRKRKTDRSENNDEERSVCRTKSNKRKVLVIDIMSARFAASSLLDIAISDY